MFACFAPKSGFFALFFLRLVVRLYRGAYLLVVIEDIDNDRHRDEYHRHKRRVANALARCGTRAVRAHAEQERARDNDYRLAHLVGKVTRGEEHTGSVLTGLYRVILREIREDRRGDNIGYRYRHGYDEADEYRKRLRAYRADNELVVENGAVEQNIGYARAEQQRLFADLARQDIDERIGHYADSYRDDRDVGHPFVAETQQISYVIDLGGVEEGERYPHNEISHCDYGEVRIGDRSL